MKHIKIIFISCFVFVLLGCLSVPQAKGSPSASGKKQGTAVAGTGNKATATTQGGGGSKAVLPKSLRSGAGKVSSFFAPVVKTTRSLWRKVPPVAQRISLAILGVLGVLSLYRFYAYRKKKRGSATGAKPGNFKVVRRSQAAA